jgi:diguanylate cyclase (GGDEF)-like protein
VRVRVSRPTEIVLGLVVPLLAVLGLLALGISTDQAAVCVAFMAAVPMFAAMFTGAAFTGIVAAATLVGAMVTAASAYGQDFYDAVPILVGVIVGAGAAVIASQMKAAAATPRPGPAPQQSASGGEAPQRPAEPGTDELTGLPTRAGVAEALSSASPAGPRVVALLDCEGVAAINDQYGRDIGDVFLFAVAGRTRWALPEEDTVARWDGGTFLMVINGDVATVQPTLELVADKVNKNPIRCDAGLVPTTVSLGAAVWSEGTDFAAAVDRARRALHAAKSRGPAQLVVDA